jgi:hypothetical protein
MLVTTSPEITNKVRLNKNGRREAEIGPTRHGKENAQWALNH